MPFIRIDVGGGPLDTETTQELQRRATDLVVSVLGKRREVSAVLVAGHPAGAWAIGAEAVSGMRAANVDVKITRGTNSAEEKAGMVAATAAMLEEVLGAVPEATYVVIDEVDGGAWGYDGRTQAARAAGRL